MLGCRHEGGELVDRDKKSANRKRPHQCHLMKRAFIFVAAIFTLRRTHREGARRHDNHLRTLTAFLEDVTWRERTFLGR